MPRSWVVLLAIWFGGSLAFAQPYMPRVTSASLGSSSTRAPGDTLIVNFTLAQGTPASVVNFNFDSGNYARTVTTSSPAGGVATIVVGADWPNGTYHLTEITITDSIGREIDYSPSGVVTYNDAPWLSPAPGPTPNASTLDFTIAGGLSTVVVPAITSFSRASADVLTAGSPITFNFTVAPGSSPSWTVTFFLRTPDQRSISLSQTIKSGTQGTISLPTTAEWANGTYGILSSVRIYDANSVAVYPRGSALVPATMDFQLVGGVASVVLPNLTAVGRSSAATVNLGEAVKVTFSATPGTSAIAEVDFNFGSLGGMTRTLTAKNSTSGTATTTVTSDWLNGQFILNSVTVTDVLGRNQTFGRTGPIYSSAQQSFPSLDFQVTGALTIPPTITSQPQGGTVQPGQSLTLSVAVKSLAGVTSWQWYVGQPGDTSTPVPQGNSSQFTPAAPASTTTYWVRVTTPNGTVDSAGATIQLAYPSSLPTIVTQPIPIDRLVNNGGSLDVVVVGPPPLSYQWFKDGAAAAGATSASLSFNPGQLSDSGSYVLKITNPNGTVSTNPVTIVFEDTPKIQVQPVGQTAKVGDSVTFSVTATGGNLRYSWTQDNSSPILGATINGNTLTIASVQPYNAGTYQVRINNQASGVLSAPAVLTVTGGPPPTVNVSSTILATLNQSFTNYLSAGGSAIIGYAATGLPPGLSIDANTGLVSGAPTTVGTYPATFSVTNGGGTTTVNTTFIVSSGAIPPVVTLQPASQTAVLHTSVTFTADVATNTDSVSAQWNFNGQPISGERGSTLTVHVDSGSKAGDYTVDFSNSAGTTRSASAHLTVDAAHSAPYLTGATTDQTAIAGATATLSVSVDGTAPLSVQWYRYNAAISGATAATYTITNASTQDTAQYFATIKNAYGSISSQTQTLIVNYLASPANQSIVAGDTASISVPASSAVTSYRWYEGKSGDTSKLVAGASGPTLITPPLTQSTSYWVWVTSADKFAFSSAATITVTTTALPPTIATGPKDQVGRAGASVTFAVVAGGTAPFTYQWQKNATAIAGATAATYTLASVQPADAGAYSVLVKNAAGSVVSPAATLRVVPANFGGVYFGQFANNDGLWALYVRPDNTGVFIDYLRQNRSAAITSIVVTADGSFASPDTLTNAGTPARGARLTAAAAAPLVSGQISFGSVTGQVGASGGDFGGTADVSNGTPNAQAGYYSAPAIGTSSAMIYAVVGPSGQTLVVTTTTSSADAAAGTLDPKNQLTATTQSGAQMNVNVAQSGISASLTSASSAGLVTFAGLSDGVISTARLVNISVRGNAGVGDQVLIIGFVISGAGGKQTLVRGIGPTLAGFGVNGVLPDPQLTLFSADGTRIGANATWGGTATLVGAFDQVGAFALPANSKDAALLQALAAGGYTAQIASPTTTGIALVEAFDADTPLATARMSNFSVRSTAGSGEKTLTAGFVVGGNGPRRILIRGIGPTLASFGVAGVLANPQLSVFDGQQHAIAQNAGWAGDATLATVFAKVGAFALPSNSTDAAIIATLAPGGYTVQVAGANAATGVVLLEVYEAP